MSESREVVRFDPSRRGDFFRLHGAANGCGWCFCVAWWVPTWDGWGERTAVENRRLREELFDRGEHDGYLLYSGGVPAGWCQAGPRDRLAKLVRQFARPADPEAWAITCFQIAPAHRRQGLAGYLLAEVLADLKQRGARRVEAYPKRAAEFDPLEMWTGPESLYAKAGFRVLADHARGPVLGLEL